MANVCFETFPFFAMICVLYLSRVAGELIPFRRGTESAPHMIRVSRIFSCSWRSVVCQTALVSALIETTTLSYRKVGLTLKNMIQSECATGSSASIDELLCLLTWFEREKPLSKLESFHLPRVHLLLHALQGP